MKTDLHKKLTEIKKIQNKLHHLCDNDIFWDIEKDFIQIDAENMTKFAPIKDWDFSEDCDFFDDSSSVIEYRIIINGVAILAVKHK